jgi:hypothetical protein
MKFRAHVVPFWDFLGRLYDRAGEHRGSRGGQPRPDVR